MTQGKVIHYNGNEGQGIVSVDGCQYPFTIDLWRGDCAPELNMTVRLELTEDGDVLGVLPLPPGVQAACAKAAGTVECAAEGVAGPAAGRALARQAGERGKRLAGQMVGRMGIGPLASYALFVVAALMGGAVSIGLAGVSVSGSLYAVLGKSALAGLLWVSGLSIVLPCVWPDKRAWLACFIPLCTVVLALLSLYSEYAQMRDAIKDIGSMLGSLGGAGIKGRGFFELVSLGLGFYLAAASSAALAFFGWQRFSQAA